jgi:hypothetical protein
MAATASTSQSDVQSTCTVIITNNLSVPLSLQSKAPQQGSWTSDPPESIAAGGKSPALILTPSDVEHGTSGSLVYTAQDGTQEVEFTFSFQCPGSHVKASCSVGGSPAYGYAVPFQATVGDAAPSWNLCPGSGAPLSVIFSVWPRIHSIELSPPGANQVWFPVLDADATVCSSTLWSPAIGAAAAISNPGLFCGPPTGATFQVTVINDAQNLGSYRLVARDPNKVFQFVSDSVVASGLSSVLCMHLQSWSGNPTIASLNQSVSWDMGNRNEIVASTPLELYWGFGIPQPMWSGGVWVTALQDIFGTLIPSWISILQKEHLNVQDACVQLLVKACFSGTLGGGTTYRKNYALNQHFLLGQVFALWDYRNNIVQTKLPYANANCVDQTGLVQTMLGAIGIQTECALYELLGTTAGGNCLPSVRVLPGVSISTIESELWSEHEVAIYSKTQGVLDATIQPGTGANPGTLSYSQYAALVFRPDMYRTSGESIGPANFQVVCTNYGG